MEMSATENARPAIEDVMLDAGGIPIAARWVRPQNATPDLPVVVFLHEGLGCIPMWKDFPERIAQLTGLPCFIYDRQGYGKSAPFSGPRELEYLDTYGRKELPAVLEAAGITRPPILFGHSDGGSVALKFASAFPTHALITEAAHIYVDERTKAGIRAAMEIWETTDLRDRLARYQGDRADAVYHAWADTWMQPEFWEWRMDKDLPSIKCPALIIQGADDEYGQSSQVHDIVAGIGNRAKGLILPDCAHIPHFQATGPVIEATVSFLRDLGVIRAD